MPVININQFMGLHDGIPNSGNFASRCDNLVITEHGKLSKRGGVHQLVNQTFDLSTVVAMFLMDDKFDAQLSLTPSELNTKCLFVVLENGEMYSKIPDQAIWREVVGCGVYRSLFTDRVITSANLRTNGDIGLVSFALDYIDTDATGNGSEKLNFILFQAGGENSNIIVDRWYLSVAAAPSFGIGAITTSLPSVASGKRIVAAVFKQYITTARGTIYEIAGEPIYDSFEFDVIDFEVAATSGRSTATRPWHFAPSRANVNDFYHGAIIASDTYSTIEIYITEENGSVLYRHAALHTNGSSTYSFNATSLTYIANAGPILYTQAGEIENNEFRFMSNIATKTSNGVFWCLDEKSGRVRQSKPNAPYAWPGSYETTFSDAVVGVGSIGKYPIVFTQTGCFRIEGFVASDGSGTTRVQSISSTVGAINHEGIVEVDNSIYFLAAEGVYRTDGFKVTKLSDHINKTYATMFNAFDFAYSERGAISSTYDNVNKTIMWVVKSTLNTGPDVLVGYPSMQHDQGMVFTTMSGDAFKQRRLAYINNAVLVDGRTGSSGAVMALSTSSRELDPDMASDNINFFYDIYQDIVSSITFNYLSSPISFGDKVARKWVARAFYTLNKLTQAFNASFQPYGVNDHTGTHDMTAIRHQGSSRTLPVIKRHFPRQFLRCTHKQVGIREATVVLFRSDDKDLFDIAGGIATLQSGSFSTDDALSPLSHTLYLEADNYTTGYPIVSSSGSGVTATGVPNSSGVKWQIKGVARDEPLLIDDIAIEYTPIGEGHIDYTPSRGGDNA